MRRSLEFVRQYIKEMEVRYKFRPLPRYARSRTHNFYATHLNGFINPQRPLYIKGQLIAHNFDRVCIGDYGAYVEIDPTEILVSFFVEPGQEWRMDEAYIERRGLNVKYRWFNILGMKLYHQLGEVSYADYKVGKCYISVLDFDLLPERI